jgi:hypothetical protein
MHTHPPTETTRLDRTATARREPNDDPTAADPALPGPGPAHAAAPRQFDPVSRHRLPCLVDHANQSTPDPDQTPPGAPVGERITVGAPASDD